MYTKLGQGDLLAAHANSCTSECRSCLGEADRSDLSDRGLCASCEARLYPRCDCGCGQEARIVADVVFDGVVIQRSPWADIEHALGAHDTANRPTIDVVVDARDFPRILAAAPCWCGHRATTELPWCPCHGAKE